MTNTIKTPIVDKNGKSTHVHKRSDDSTLSKNRISSMNAPKRADDIGRSGVLSDGTKFKLYGNAHAIEVDNSYVDRQGSVVPRLHYSLGKKSSARFDLKTESNHDFMHDKGALKTPSFAIIERDEEGITYTKYAYESPVSKWASAIDTRYGDAEDRRNVLEGYLSAKYSGHIIRDNGKDFVLITRREQNQDYIDELRTSTTELDTGIYNGSSYADTTAKFVHDFDFVQNDIAKSALGVKKESHIASPDGDYDEVKDIESYLNKAEGIHFSVRARMLHAYREGKIEQAQEILESSGDKVDDRVRYSLELVLADLS